MKTNMYDALSADYDRFVNWDSRLAFEMPFIEEQLGALSGQPGRILLPVRVLDAACGTGKHAIQLARRGYAAAGADLSPAMIARALENAAADLPDPGMVRFATAGFGELANTFSSGMPGTDPGLFDALLCLGNSLPHVLKPQHLAAALADFAACLRPGGLLLIQNRNYDSLLSTSRAHSDSERWMEPQAHREGNSEWIFLRFYDFEARGLINFNMITLHRSGDENWQQQVSSTPLCPLRKSELSAALETAGFNHVKWYGSLQGEPFDAQKSGNLVAVAVAHTGI